MRPCTLETEEELREWSDLVAIGRVAKSQGRKGEVAVNPLTDFPERFLDLPRVFVEGSAGVPSALTMEEARLHKGRPVVKFTGVSNITEAQALAGKELRIPSTEVKPLPDGSFYHFEIAGLEVFDRQHGRLGVAEKILTTGGTDVLVVRPTAGGELLLPFCKEICRRIDVGGGVIEVEVPEGLIELNAD